MKLRTRRIFFWSLIPCFLVGGAGIVAYSQGYRIDMKTHAVTKIGALYVRGYPRNATITLDGEPLNTGSWWPLQSGTLYGGLVPGSYKLHAEADGFRTWDSNVTIRPSLVTERKSLILFPGTASTVPTMASTSFSAIDAPDSLDDIVLVPVGKDVTEIGGVELAGSYIGTSGGRIATTLSQKQGKKVTRILRFQSPDADAATTVAYTGDVLGVMDDSVVVRESATQVAAYLIGNGTRSVIATTSAPQVIGNILHTSSYDAWEQHTATSSKLVVQPHGQARIVVPISYPINIDPAGSQIGVRDRAGSLWLVNPQTGAAKEIANRAVIARWRADGSSVAAVIDDQLEVIGIKENVPHGKLTGTLAKGDAVNSITWYPDGEHLFVALKDTLLFVDIMEGGSTEQHTYRLSLQGPWAFSDTDKTLYAYTGREVARYVFPN
jgi:hypothetical protein